MHTEIVRERGPDAPASLPLPVVYMPGIDGAGDLMLGTEALLARHTRVVCLGYRTDASSSPPLPPDYAQLAATAARELERRAVGPALVIAESFGAGVALRLALDHPERVAGLLLVNGFARHPWRIRLHVTRLVCGVVPAGLVRWVQGIASRGLLFGKLGDPAATKAFRQRGFGGLSRAWLQRLTMLTRLDLRSELPQVTQPATIIAAARDRIVPSVRCGRALAESLPDARFEIVDAAGHLILPLASIPWERHVQELCARAHGV